MTATRRSFVSGALAAAGTATLKPAPVLARNNAPATRPIPSTGEQLAMVGLGSWITFNVGRDQMLLDESAAVIRAFLDAGGQMIDSSPLYGSAQATIGYGLGKHGGTGKLFSADKVWISRVAAGAAQMEQSRKRWGVPRFDLLQVHNLVSWEGHLETLLAMKTAGKLRYVGVTTSHGRRHRELEQVMKSRPIDFVQLTYNIADREVEARLLPLAQEKGIAVIVNRPFRRGSLPRRLQRHPLPDWAGDTGASSWAQFLLKFILSHPAVTCVIPATTRVGHVRENVAAATQELPDAALRRRMLQHVLDL
ncbi:MAG: aldo/keto reductase [Hyphomicrobiaceae bacterium]